MKGVRFYLEHESPAHKRRGDHTGNVAAIFPDNRFWGGGLYLVEGIGPLLDDSNSPVCGCSYSLDFLRTCCKRIPESKAREIHPRLFERLDMED